MEGSEVVKLKIKSPSCTISDIELEVVLTTSVYQLKELIKEKFPGNPSPSAQKLLYAGKLLKDVDTLEQFLRFDDDCTVYSLHLACAIPPSSNPTVVNHNVRNEQVSNTPDGAMEQGAADTLGWQWQQMMAGMYGQNMVGGYSMVNLGPTEIQQLALVQQMYTQYLAEYMHYTAGAGSVADSTALLGQGGEGEQQGVNQEQVVNAGGGGQIEQEQNGGGIGGGNRDLLDWLYVMSRLVVLASIVYFYSSLTRFMVVAGVVGLLYLYQAGYFGQRDRVDVIRGEVDRIRVREVQEVVNNAGGGEVPDEQHDDSGDDATLEHDPQNLQLEPDDPDELLLNPLTMARNFVTMFFTSLIPDNNQVI